MPVIRNGVIGGFNVKAQCARSTGNFEYFAYILK